MITAEANSNIVCFLDLNLALATGKHKPYRKPNGDPLYIDKNSNHAPSIEDNYLVEGMRIIFLVGWKIILKRMIFPQDKFGFLQCIDY